MNLVPEHIDEAIKHLTPKSEDEMYEAWVKRINEIVDMHPSEMITAIYEEIRDYTHTLYPPTSKLSIAAKLLGNVSREERKKAIEIVLNDYIFR